MSAVLIGKRAGANDPCADKNFCVYYYRLNDEVMQEFFDSLGFRKRDKLTLLKDDISILLHPSRQRAMMLNKAYWLVVKEQSFIKGRDGNIKATTPLNAYQDLQNNQLTAVPYKTY